MEWQGLQGRQAPVEVPHQLLAQRGRSMERSNFTRTVRCLANVVVPDHLAVRGIQERHAVSPKIEASAPERLRVARGLAQDGHWAASRLLAFKHPNNSSIDAERVVGRPSRRRVFLDSARVKVV